MKERLETLLKDLETLRDGIVKSNEPNHSELETIKLVIMRIQDILERESEKGE